MDVGSQTADLAGLYHYPSTTNQVKKAMTRVNLGFHYVALNNATARQLEAGGRER